MSTQQVRRGFAVIQGVVIVVFILFIGVVGYTFMLNNNSTVANTKQTESSKKTPANNLKTPEPLTLSPAMTSIDDIKSALDELDRTSLEDDFAELDNATRGL